MLAGLLRETHWGAPFETHFILKYLNRLPRYGDLSNIHNMARLLGDILKERSAKQWWDTEFDVETFCASLEEPTYECLIDTFCRRRIRNFKAPGWGDKTPHYVLELERLSVLFPESKFIVIVRDGRDVAMSLLAKPWGPSNVASCARYWVRCVERRPIYDQLLTSNRLVEIRYEELLERPEQELGRVLDCLEVTEDRESIIAGVERVDRRNKDKWRNKMSAVDQGIFQQIAASALEANGYEVVPNLPQPSPLKLVGYNAHERLSHALQLIRANTVDAFAIKYMGRQPFAD